MTQLIPVCFCGVYEDCSTPLGIFRLERRRTVCRLEKRTLTAVRSAERRARLTLAEPGGVTYDSDGRSARSLREFSILADDRRES